MLNLTGMGGHVTWTGVAVIAVSAILKAFDLEQYSGMVFDIGVALGLVGLGRKADRDQVAKKIKVTRKELREALEVIKQRRETQ